MTDEFRGAATPLTEAAFNNAVTALGASPAALWALLTVETRGFGFLPDRRPKILFERHVFHKRTGGRFDSLIPDLSAATRGGYAGGAAEYARLARAIGYDRTAALQSASWGLGQVMGFNAVALRYASVEEMVTAFVSSEDAQLDGVVRFILANPGLAKAFRHQTWGTVAFYYNGSDYAAQGYEVKLLRYFDLYDSGTLPSIDIRTAQARLTYLGLDPRGVDGVLGHGTRAALLAFQKARGIPPTGDLDANTATALNQAVA